MVDYQNNQGCINARVVSLMGDREATLEYVRTLTPEQKELARGHLRTVRAINDLQKKMLRD